MSLRARIGAVAGLAVALSIVVVAVAVYEGTRSELRGEIDSALDSRVQVFTSRPPGPPGAAGPERGPRLRERSPSPVPDGGPPPFGRPDDGPSTPAPPPVPFGGAPGSIQFVTPDGSVFGPPGRESSAIPVGAGARAIAAAGTGRHYADTHADGVHIRVLTAGLGPRGAVQVARPLTEVDNVLRRQLVLLVIVGAVGIAIAALLGMVVARTALAPIARFTRRTESLAASPDPSQRLEVVGRDELARLAQSFNRTLDALQASVEAQRNLVADASHELRTPISSLRANIQLLQDADRLSAQERAALRDDVIEELDELTALVADVVELARGSKGDDALDDVRVDEITGELLERARRRAPEVVFDAQVEPAIVRGEPGRIARAVSNLLDNASRWSPPRGTVEVRLKDGVLTVRDHGPGFAEEDLPHVFDRFYRAAEARKLPGSGLGLAIVRQAAEAHGGWVKAANAPGGGAVLRVSFGPPVSPAI
jgi:two-component system sensor histidine kinase MprB